MYCNSTILCSCCWRNLLQSLGRTPKSLHTSSTVETSKIFYIVKYGSPRSRNRCRKVSRTHLSYSEISSMYSYFACRPWNQVLKFLNWQIKLSTNKIHKKSTKRTSLPTLYLILVCSLSDNVLVSYKKFYKKFRGKY